MDLEHKKQVLIKMDALAQEVAMHAEKQKELLYKLEELRKELNK